MVHFVIVDSTSMVPKSGRQERMSTKEQRRQKKLAKKRSKQVADRKQRARERDTLQSLAGQIKSASTGAIEHCLISDELMDPTQRLGTVLISRRLPDRRLACVRFLIDGMCLGVKDIDGFTCFPAQLTELLEKLEEVETLRRATPQRVRKLVESAIAYAAQFDLQPPADYRKVSAIWGDIDAEQCEEEFSFGGEGGKPNYISGPNDSALFQTRVLETLERTAGQGNFTFTFMGSQMMGSDLLTPLDPDDESFAFDDPELDVDIDEDVIDATSVIER